MRADEPDVAYWRETFQVVGGNPALDFVNTLSERRSPAPLERLRTYADLVLAAERIGLVGPREAGGLGALAAARPAQAEAARRQAVGLRETLHRLFLAEAERRPPADADLSNLNEALAGSLGHLRLARTSGGIAWSWENAPQDLTRPLWPLARAAAELLACGPLDRLRECAAADCGWLFLDTTKNASRRWCLMQECGNRAKARRHRARAKTGGDRRG